MGLAQDDAIYLESVSDREPFPVCSSKRYNRSCVEMGKKKDYRELLTTPFDTGIRNFTTVAKFFLYYAPTIDSAQSVGGISDDLSIKLCEEMLKKADMDRSSRFLKKIQASSWRKDDLEGIELDFDKPRMLCSKYSSEDDLHALLRHIRNSFAHGYLYVWKRKSGSRIFLMDYDSGKQKMTAKIMVSMHILEMWKSILEK